MHRTQLVNPEETIAIIQREQESEFRRRTETSLWNDFNNWLNWLVANPSKPSTFEFYFPIEPDNEVNKIVKERFALELQEKGWKVGRTTTRSRPEYTIYAVDPPVLGNSCDDVIP